MAVTPDGAVVFLERHPVTGSDLWVFHRWPPNAARRHAVQRNVAAVSADGKSVAYASDESGRSEVYAIPIFRKARRMTVSIDGGTGPIGRATAASSSIAPATIDERAGPIEPTRSAGRSEEVAGRVGVEPVLP